MSEESQQVNLAAFGFGGFPGVSPVVGPFSVFDIRARLTQTVWDSELIHELRAARAALEAETQAGLNVRDLVVRVVADLYFQAVTGASRVEAAQIQLDAAQVFYDRAVDLQQSGVVAGIDRLRAEVELERERGNLIFLRNALARQKLDLARAIGVDLGRNVTLTSALPSGEVPLPPAEEVVSEALDTRPDYQRALALVRAAEEDLSAARGQRHPSLDLSADYGDIGRSPGSSHGTYSVRGTLTLPLFRGREIEADVLRADAFRERRRAELASLASRIEYDVRASYLDIVSARQRVTVDENARGLARQELDQAQDRFAAGVASSVEVVQAQQMLSVADENYIMGLFALNVARIGLARAVGGTEAGIQRFLGGIE